MKPEGSRGQVLVLFALMLVAFLGMAALAIDVSSVLSEMRAERGFADTAALSGASDMYRQGSTIVAAPEYRNGRTHAMQNLMDALSPTFVAGDPTLGVLPTCGGVPPPYDSNIVNCQVPGSPYYVSIFAPAPTCVQLGGCDPVRSVQVTVRNPRHGLTFARLFGQSQWNLAVTSIAERNRGTNYSFVTLRPPEPSRADSSWCRPDCDANDEDILLDGTNTKLTVRGDMGTNTNMRLTAGATVNLVDPGSFVDRYDAYKLWSGPPPDRQISAPIPDPNYTIPARTGAATLADAASAHMPATDCNSLVTTRIPGTYNVNASGVGTGEVVCLKPGVYTYAPGGGSAYAHVTTMILSPGVYFFDRGFMPGNDVRVIGGYEPGLPGVALIFHDGGACPFPGGCDFAGNAVELLALNAGDAYPNGNSGTAAKAALTVSGSPVQTSGRVPVPMTLMVEKDAACTVTIPDPCGSNENQNHQLSLPGSGSIHVFGVQYGPTDNMKISGGSGSNGFLGQIWAWTVQYTGGSNINLVGAANPEPGVLRIATPCSPATACANPEATVTLP